MIVTLLCEPRSGSTNFANWFYNNSDFTIFYNPDMPTKLGNSTTLKWYQNGIHPKNYEYKTKHLLIKEDYYPNKNYKDFLDVSDKVILLFRENEKEQIDSWVNAVTTNNWDSHWEYKKIENKEQEDYFKNLKKSFKSKFLNNSNYFKISYEDLYDRNKINDVIEYLKIDITNSFPSTKTHRYRFNKSKTLI
jgi:hypothetical protein